ncbi:50S ribosomal protein L13 [Mycoplasma sp. (ex Biomphalaria glabrata)]|uniref:50S ribosomal protein L13 n=1 Tax=Mycoplasma sp. (ex Biomphalaria glabrata) TaxID=1749074 RepID=UPI00073AE21C|nr:50S ribosomal protein L13 [Mycoplasma sp. (ex Biomphalaria glabrata)]ALV23417.1 50S ribosomal protein L13 [Mycoplasma sp. (ex Biomphalaria glabrata)]
MRQTTNLKHLEVNPQWFLIDAQGQVLGRLATQIADLLRGKNKPDFTPNVDSGAFIVVINADKIVLTGNKLNDKIYYSHSMYPGGLKQRTAKDMLAKFPERVLEKAVHGMIPHTKLGDKQRKKLFVYAGDKHPHEAQQPIKLDL